MKISQKIINSNGTADTIIRDSSTIDNQKVQLVLAFGTRHVIHDHPPYDKLRAEYPNADIVITSTAGQFQTDELNENDVVYTAIEFEDSQISCHQREIKSRDYENEVKELMDKIDLEDTKLLLVFSEGTHINGTYLTESINDYLEGRDILVFGGLAGDGELFKKTNVGLNQNPKEHTVIIVAIKNPNLKTSISVNGGWVDYGPMRLVTKSKDNVLYEIEGKNALDLYKEYLGKYADELPGAALYYPLSMEEEGKDKVVRTILSIDEKNKSMVFAGNIPEGSRVRLMNSNSDNLVEAAFTSVEDIYKTNHNPELILVMSCVGRKMVLGERIEEEIDAIHEQLGKDAVVTGFFTYGEIARPSKKEQCTLHNQTFTIASISEK